MQLLKSTITHQERKKIFALKRELKLKKDELYDYMVQWCNCTSLQESNCSSSQAKTIIKNLSAMKNKDRPGFITVNQRKALTSMRSQLRWSESDLNKFVLHTVGKDSLDDLTVQEASRMIVGLKKANNI